MKNKKLLSTNLLSLAKKSAIGIINKIVQLLNKFPEGVNGEKFVKIKKTRESLKNSNHHSL